MCLLCLSVIVFLLFAFFCKKKENTFEHTWRASGHFAPRGPWLAVSEARRQHLAELKRRSAVEQAGSFGFGRRRAIEIQGTGHLPPPPENKEKRVVEKGRGS